MNHVGVTRTIEKYRSTFQVPQPSRRVGADRLGVVLHKLFPNTHIITNARKEGGVISPFTGKYLELDFWLPDLRLAFEYQDPHHYVSIFYADRPPEWHKRNADIKKKELDKRGNTLIEIPCWWDASEESLIATIKKFRKDLLDDYDVGAEPIPELVPSNFFDVNPIPDVGELMLASFPDVSEIVTNWWVSEKYDGIRVCWHPERKKFYSRYGREIETTPSIPVHLPSIYLDLELWFGRGRYSEIVKLNSKSNDWSNGRLMIIDNPFLTIDSAMPFESRIERILNFVAPGNPILIAMSYCKLKDTGHIRNFTHFVLSDGGEGAVVRKPSSVYEHGRSTSLLKYKAQKDHEGLVYEIKGNECILKLSDGRELTAKLAPTLLSKPNPGDVITFGYTGLSKKGNFIYPYVFRIRTDLNWEDVLENADSRNEEHANLYTERTLSEKVVHFNVERAENINEEMYSESSEAEEGMRLRALFENVARRKGFDPLVPENWYALSWTYLKDIATEARKKHGRYHEALIAAFPELHWDEFTFLMTRQKDFWVHRENRKSFFDRYAQKKGFDPLVAQNWYSVELESISKERGGRGVMKPYNEKLLSRALMDLYPDIGLHASKFNRIPNNFFHDANNARHFLDEVAMKHNFDPLIVENWYKITWADIKKEKGLPLLLHYNGSLTGTLKSLYPELTIDDYKFTFVPKKYYSDIGNQLNVFNQFAKQHNFDPLIPENWYTPRDTMSSKGMIAVLRRYNLQLSTALSAIYPQVPFDSTKFRKKRNAKVKNEE